jgi:hypothetical protein
LVSTRSEPISANFKLLVSTKDSSKLLRKQNLDKFWIDFLRASIFLSLDYGV